MAAGPRGRDHLRASHADREQVVGTLKAAFVAGMLDKDEFEVRVGQALASRTYAQLAALTADLPAGLAAAQPPEPARAGGGQPLLRPGPVITWATVLNAVAWAFVFSPAAANIHKAFALFIMGNLVYLSVMAIAVAVALENRRDRRSGGQLPRGQAPGAVGPAFPSLSPDELPPAGPGDRHTEAVRRRRARPPWPVRGQCAAGALAAGTAPASG
jgi:Domain of unknown function (DUF1707)